MNAHADPGHAALDADLATLTAGKDAWAQTPVADRITLLREIKRLTGQVAEAWAETAARKKGLAPGAPQAGEEWLSGPYAVIRACDGLIRTLEGLEGHRFLRGLKKRYLPHGQLAVEVVPSTPRDALIMPGLRAEVWMREGVSEVTLPATTATAYATPEAERRGAVALVLGAGNIASIPVLDVFQKLFVENQVVLLKMNPVNAYLRDAFQVALGPLIARDALRIVTGGGEVGAYLCEHAAVEEIHITGAGATHDLIVWGAGEAGVRAKAAGTPRNKRCITSELGAVCPTIIVPGPWSQADIAHQAAQVATQKMVNAGFNCVSTQVLLLPEVWAQKAPFLRALKRVLAAQDRPAYYPGAEDRSADFAERAPHEAISRGAAPDFILSEGTSGYFAETEVFAHALSTHDIAGEGEAFLRAAIGYANDTLHGTLGANIVIHPATLAGIGKARFEACLRELRYGNIAVNAWTGASFALTEIPWGAFPGHTLEDVQSGIGTVHNTLMFEGSERTVLYGPWAPIPRAWALGERHLMPVPPWFVTHKRADKVARALVAFAATGRRTRLAALLWHALRG
ncbi:MAG: aldehyde dehydrogenase family protein [Pseudomonadota bacterium]